MFIQRMPDDLPEMETLVLHMRTCDGSIALATRMRSLWKLRDDGKCCLELRIFAIYDLL